MFPFQQPQNPIFSMFGSMQNFNNQFNNFKQNFSQQGFGNPQALVQNMLNSGQMTQSQFNQLSAMADAIMGHK
jgi:hypothetical protein